MCSSDLWYLEMAKPSYGHAMDAQTYQATLEIFEDLLRLLHPFMPFLTEEIWQYLRERTPSTGSICVAEWPKEHAAKNDRWTNAFQSFSETVNSIRNIRISNQIPNKESLEVMHTGDHQPLFDAAIMHLCNLKSLTATSSKPTNCFSFVLHGVEYFVPFTANVDVEGEKQKVQEELEYTRGFLASVETKLSNERFVSKAPPAVLDGERKKQQDAQNKIALLEARLTELNG